MKLAKSKGVTLVHPGYGFMSENAEFARACEREGITFVGPSVNALNKLGNNYSVKVAPGKYEPGKEKILNK